MDRPQDEINLSFQMLRIHVAATRWVPGTVGKQKKGKTQRSFRPASTEKLRIRCGPYISIYIVVVILISLC